MRFSTALRHISKTEGKYANAYITYHDGRRRDKKPLYERILVELRFEYELENIRGKKPLGGFRPVVAEDNGMCRIWNIVDMHSGEIAAEVEVDLAGIRRPQPEDNKVRAADCIDTHRYPWWMK